MSRDRSRTEVPDGERNRDPYDDDGRSTYGGTDGTAPSGVIPFGFPTTLGRGASDDAPADEGYDGGYDADDGTSYRREVARGDVDDESSIGEGVIEVVLLTGVALFVFPEPATSAIGILLVVAGVLAWLADRTT